MTMQVRPNIIRMAKSRRKREAAALMTFLILWTGNVFPALASAYPPGQFRSRFTQLGLSGVEGSPQSVTEPSSHPATQPPSHPPLRELCPCQMKRLFGAGEYRDNNRSGQLPWWRLYKGVNVVNGNLYRSYTDLSYPSRMMNMSFTRTYNSNNDQADQRGPDALRVAPFGRGWDFSYDLQCYADPQDPTLLDRQSANGAEIPYQVDADGLVTPPVYAHDKTALTKRMLRTPDGMGGFTNTVLEYDLDGNRLDSNTIPQADNNEFFLEFTREGKDGGHTSYRSYERLANGDPTGYYKATRIEDRYGSTSLTAGGNATTYTYGMNITLPSGKTDALLTQITDTVGRNVTITWANLGSTEQPYYRITAVTDPINRTWAYQYTTVNCGNVPTLSSVTDPANRTTTYTYTSLTSTTGAIEYGLLASEASPMGRTTAYEHQLLTWQAAQGQMPSIVYVWVKSVTEASGDHWNIIYYNEASFPRVFTLTALGLLPTFRPDNYGRINGYSLCENAMLGDTWVGWQWNNAFQLTQSFVANGSKSVMTYDTVFDMNGNVLEPGQGNMLEQKTYVQYDPPVFDTTTMTYYDDSKYYQNATTTDPLGRVTTQDYFTKTDAFVGNRGNPWKVTDAKGGVTEFSYNQYGQKASMKDAEGRIWTYTYGTNGDLTKTTWPDGTYTEATYDSIGRPTQTKDRKGNVGNISYNTIGQPTSISFADATSVAYTYNNDGQALSVTDARGTTSYSYDGATGNLLSATDPITGTVSYEYNSIGQRKTLIYPNGLRTTYQYVYDTYVTSGGPPAPIYSSNVGDVDVRLAGYPTPITDPWGYTTKSVMYPAGIGEEFVESVIAKDPTTGNPSYYIRTEPKRDLKGRLTFTHTYKGGSPAATHLLGFEYDYDSIDNRLHMYEITGDRGQTTTRISTEGYTYDELSRLTNVTYPSTSSGQASPTQAYTFDHVGNRLTLNDNGTQKSYTYNNINELTSGTDGSWTYDLNGNTLTDPQRSYTWDVQNRMTSCTKGNTTVNFTYRADGLRARKQVVGGTTTDYVYDGQTVIGEIVKDTNGNVTKKVWYTPGPNGYINRTETNPSDVVTNKEWFVYDGLGSCRAMVKPNTAGTDAIISARYDYDVYGKVRTNSGSSTNTMKYVGGSCGHPTDDETGLIYMRARYYDPGTGRFAGEDPLRHRINWYRYGNANPVRYVDVSGEVTGDINESAEASAGAQEAEGAGGEAAADQVKRYCTNNLKKVFNQFRDRFENAKSLGNRIHEIKNSNGIPGDVDLWFNIRSGDVYVQTEKGAMELIDSLFF